MIDIESQVFTRVYERLEAGFPGIAVKSLPERVPKSFPAVSVVEVDNAAYERTQSSDSLENHAQVFYEVDIYTTGSARKSQARKIAKAVDAEFARMGFTRTFSRPTPNLSDETVYRITARYRAVVSKDNVIFRR